MTLTRHLLVRVGLSVPLAAAVVLAASALAPPAAQGADPTSAFAIEYSRGDAGLLTTPEYTFTSGVDWYAPLPNLQITDGVNTWNFAATGVGGAPLVAGQTYENAWGSTSPDRPFMKLDSWGACSTSWPSYTPWVFTVHDVAYDSDSSFSRLSLSFAIPGSVSGEIRFNTAAPAFTAIQHDPFCQPWSPPPDVHVGESLALPTQTIHNVGANPVTLGQAGIVGRDAADYAIAADTCSNKTLAVGDACVLAAQFTPSQRGYRGAELTVGMDFGSGVRSIGLNGNGTVATTTDITGPTGMTWSPVTLEAQVTPNPAADRSRGFTFWFEFPDDPSRNVDVQSDLDGHARAEVYLPPGDHRVYGKFYASGDFETSQSPTITLRVGESVATTLEISASKTSVVTTERPTVSASLSPAGVTGGVLRIHDGETGELLGSMEVSPGNQTLTITPLLTKIGRHPIDASYLGHDQFARSHASIDVYVSEDEDVLGSVKVDPPVFYPHVDAFRDQTAITVKRDERLSVEAEIISDADGTMLYQTSAPTGATDVSFAWDGQVSGGGLAPAGYYTLRATLVDDRANAKVVERRIVLSHDWVDWSTRSVSMAGAKYSLVGKSADAIISKAKSKYSYGVRLISKSGSATVGYTLPVASSRLYRDVAFQVEGMSPNDHHAVLAIWNPDLGGYSNLSHYDAVAEIGPGFRWWSTSAPGAVRIKDGVARAIVSTWQGLGGPSSAAFDIKRVRLDYEVGELQRVTDWSTAARAVKADLVSDYLADARGGRVGRTVKGIGKSSVKPWLKSRRVPPRLPQAAVVAPAETDPSAAQASPEPVPTEEPMPTEDPQAEEDTPEPGPSTTPEPALSPTVQPIPPNRAPAADAGGPYTVDEGDSIRLDGSASTDRDGDIVAWSWTRQRYLDDASRTRPIFTALDDGDIVISLTVTDDDGASDTAASTIKVRNVDPSVKATVDAVSTSAEALTVTARFTDPGIADRHTLAIDWGDGATLALDVIEDRGTGSASASHLYAEAGDYLVTLTLADDDGGSDSTTLDVTVGAVSQGG